LGQAAHRKKKVRLKEDRHQILQITKGQEDGVVIFLQSVTFCGISGRTIEKASGMAKDPNQTPEGSSGRKH